ASRAFSPARWPISRRSNGRRAEALDGRRDRRRSELPVAPVVHRDLRAAARAGAARPRVSLRAGRDADGARAADGRRRTAGRSRIRVAAEDRCGDRGGCRRFLHAQHAEDARCRNADVMGAATRCARDRLTSTGSPTEKAMAERFVEPVTLRGTHVTLEPLAAVHLDGIRVAAADGELWRLWYTSVP